MDKNKVYVIEDDKHISELMVYKLESAGFNAKAFYDGESGLKAIIETVPDVVLLDIMLPGIDGYEICRQVRANEKSENVIIIMLTARGEENDKVLGLEIGADDYIVKPFSVREVVARVRAVLRRINRINKAADEGVLEIGDVKIIPDKREVFKDGSLIELKTKEYDLLYYLMRNAGRVLSRKQLLDDIWGYDYYGETRTVDVHISQLRLKIEDNAENPGYIKTLRSVGYKFIDIKKEGKQ